MKLQLQKVKIRQSDGSYKYLAGMKGEKGDPGDPYDATEIQKEIDDANRSLTALWELNEGKTYRFETDSTKAYSKTVPTGAKVASLEKLGGESLVWNQLFTQGLTQQNRWKVSSAPVSLVQYSNEMLTCEWVDDLKTYEIFQQTTTPLKTINHIYMTYADIYSNHDLIGRWSLQSSYAGHDFTIYGGRWDRYRDINKYMESYPLILAGIRLTPTEPTEVKFKNPIMIDLTQIFGSGNEPTDINDPRIKALEAYAEAHPDYTEGEIIDAVVNDLVYSKDGAETHTSLTLPTLRSINDNCYDEVDFERGVVIRRVGEYEMKGTEDWTVVGSSEELRAFVDNDIPNKKEAAAGLCDRFTFGIANNQNQFDMQRTYIRFNIYGKATTKAEFNEWLKSHKTTVYYELATPTEEPLTQTVEPFNVEPGGTITFKQEASEFPVNNTVEYVVKLSEV